MTEVKFNSSFLIEVTGISEIDKNTGERYPTTDKTILFFEFEWRILTSFKPSIRT